MPPLCPPCAAQGGHRGAQGGHRGAQGGHRGAQGGPGTGSRELTAPGTGSRQLTAPGAGSRQLTAPGAGSRGVDGTRHREPAVDGSRHREPAVDGTRSRNRGVECRRESGVAEVGIGSAPLKVFFKKPRGTRGPLKNNGFLHSESTFSLEELLEEPRFSLEFFFLNSIF